MKKFRKLSRRTWTMLSAVLVMVGVVMFAYPKIANLLSDQYTELTIDSFKKTIQSMETQGDITPSDDTIAAMEAVSPLDELLQKVQVYNQTLYEEGQKDLVDPFSYQVSSIDLSEYGIEDNMFGYIEIPKINVKLGIYLGATTQNMSKGAVHLTETSLPIGGANTNAVIAAHRGTRYRDMFRNIDQLAVGDEVFITNAWETLTYEVTSIAIIEPNEIDKVLIQEGRDMVTLISCNPYGQSIQRYVVYCDRATED